MDPRMVRPSPTSATASYPSPTVTVAHVPGATLPTTIVPVNDGVDGYNTALVTELLRHKRKARDVKSCFPCRHRKVRCDGGVPCSNCVKRDHVSLCRRVTTTSGASTVNKSTVSKGIPASVQSGSSVAASSPRSVGGDPYAGVSNAFATTAFDPAATGQQQQQQQQQQHHGYVDHSSPSTIVNHDVGPNGCTGYPPPPPQPQRRGPHEIASPNPQLRDSYLPPLGHGQQPQQQDDDDGILQRLENIERQIQSLKSDLIQRRSNWAYANQQPQQQQHQQTPISQFSVSEHHQRDTPDLLPRLDSIVATSNFLQNAATAYSMNNNHTRKPSSTHAHYSGSPPSSMPISHHIDSRAATSSGKQFVEEATGATIFLGKRADPPLSLGCYQDPSPIFLGGDLGPNGSGSAEGGGRVHEVQLTPRTYPFTNLWTPEAKLGDVCRTLPCQSDIIRYWQAFETYVYPFYPLLVALDEFRASIYAFLSRQPMISRPQQEGEGGHANGNGMGMAEGATSWIEENTDPSWLALLFGVLACGTQFSGDTAQERYLRSKVFICSAFQCLRTANLFFKTDLNQIQAMALVGHCLRNNLETNSAWILLGATIRLAQSIGLHEASMPGSQSAWASEVHRSQGAHLWRMIIWQDTFLSFTYDRPPVATSTILHHDMFGAQRRFSSADPTKYSFTEAVFRVCLVILDWTCEGNTIPTPSYGSTSRRNSQIRSLLSFKRQFDLILSDSVTYLRSDHECQTLQQHLERLGLQIHVASALCRMFRLCAEAVREDRVLGSGIPAVGVEEKQEEEQLMGEYAMHATEAVKGFLDMYRLSPTVCRSWPFVHNAVSSAVMLREFLVGGIGGSMQVEAGVSGTGTGTGITGTGVGGQDKQQHQGQQHGLGQQGQGQHGQGQGQREGQQQQQHQQQQQNMVVGSSQGMQALRHEWTRRSEPLVRELIRVLEKEERESEWLDADTNVRHSGPHSRALRALKESYGR